MSVYIWTLHLRSPTAIFKTLGFFVNLAASFSDVRLLTHPAGDGGIQQR